MRIFLILGFFAALTASSSAVPLKKRLVGGHAIEVRVNRDGQEQLRIDGKVRVTERYISLDAPVIVDGVTVITGSAADGGNMCAGHAFILTLPPDGPARLDGPLDTCGELVKAVDGAALALELPASAAGDGLRWIWKRAGLSGPQILKFEPKAVGGWDALAARKLDHPSQLLNFSDTAEPLRDLFGKAWNDFISTTFGPGEIKYRDGLSVATSCRAHMCDVTELLVVADIDRRAVYVAMADDSAIVTLSPPADQWPALVRADVAAFEKRWRPAATAHRDAVDPSMSAHVHPPVAASAGSSAPARSWVYGVHPVLGLSAHLTIGAQAIGIACIPQNHPLSEHVASLRMTPELWPTATQAGGVVAIVNKPFAMIGSATYVVNNAGFVEQKGGYCGLQLWQLRSAQEIIFIKTTNMKLEWTGRRNTMTVDQKGKDIVLITGADVAKLSETMTIPLTGARAAIDRLLKACPAIARMRAIDCEGGD